MKLSITCWALCMTMEKWKYQGELVPLCVKVIVSKKDTGSNKLIENGICHMRGIGIQR